MRSHHQSINNNNEAVLINQWINQPENTMNAVLTNSVGMAILLLSKQYFGESPTQLAIDQHTQHCFEQLNTIQDASLHPAIQHLIRIANEPVNALDRITLFLPTNDSTFEEVRYTFSLKEVLTLVWMALQDSIQYIDHYTGTPEQQLQAAQTDLTKRLETFFNCIKRIHTHPICHQGTRHELVFTLNKTYPGIDLIEDPRSSVMYFLKEHIHRLFWAHYTNEQLSADDKKALTTALFNWMSTSQPSDVIAIVDSQHTIEKELHALFIRHGSNPHSSDIQNILTQAFTTLSFACDPAQHPEIAMIHTLLNEIERKGQENGNQALELMQNWILNDYQLDHPDHQKKIANFYALYRAYRDFHRYQFLLEVSGTLSNSLRALADTCSDYFKAYAARTTLPILSLETWQTIPALRHAIEQSKKNTMAEKKIPWLISLKTFLRNGFITTSAQLLICILYY